MVKRRDMNDTIIVEEGILIETQELQDDIVSPAEKEDPEYANLLGDYSRNSKTHRRCWLHP